MNRCEKCFEMGIKCYKHKCRGLYYVHYINNIFIRISKESKGGSLLMFLQLEGNLHTYGTPGDIFNAELKGLA